MSEQLVTASVIGYRVIRPDGTVLWSYLVPSYMDSFTWLADAGDTLVTPDYGVMIGPPWLIQRREYGPEWVTVAEHN